ncbi:MAG: hypothetical protein ACLPJH_05835 [Myxococcaceae bacterium]
MRRFCFPKAAAAASPLLLAACLQGPGAPPVDPFKPADQALGERIFRDPRFSQYFAAHATDMNAPPSPGDPTVATSVNALGPNLPGSLAGSAVACSACHLVEQDALADGTRMRAYSDYARRSPIPDREDGQSATPRNSPPMVDALVPREGPVFLHLDGQFVTPEDLIATTFTGRNLGWLPTEGEEAVAHIASVIRADDCSHFVGPDPGLAGTSYAADFLGQDFRILARLRLPPEDRIDVFTASDQEVLSAVATVVSAYITGLRYSRDTSGAYNFSPFDVFLKLNGLPRKPNPGETPLDYARRLRTAVESLQAPRWVTADMGSYTHHAAPFVFGPTELQGLQVFLAEPLGPFRPPAEGGGGVGNCLACHTPPDFTDHLFHNTGAAQVEYDAVHGEGAFFALAVPDLQTRNANAAAYLPASAANPTAVGRFRAAPTADDPSLADLGLWNVFANQQMPNPQAALQEVLCTQPGTTDCSAEGLLPTTVGLFKTPGLRDLDDSAPYLHNGSANDFTAVLSQYQKVSDLERAGTLRNGDARLLGMNLASEDLPALEAFLHSLAEDYQ